MTDKNKIIDRLLQKNQITSEEAEILRRKEIDYIPLNPSPYVQPESQKQFQETWKNPKKHPFQVEFERVQEHIKNCPCNVANNGSGICNCTMGTMPVIC